MDILLRGYLATYSFADGVIRMVGKFDTCDEAMAACEYDARCVCAGGYVGTSSVEKVH